MLTLNGTPLNKICYPKDASETVRFAAEELQKYCEASLGINIPVTQGIPEKGVIFVLTEDRISSRIAEMGGFQNGVYDCSIIAGREGCLWMIGENPISTLYAVYDFLQEKLGIRFFGPGASHEHIPEHSFLNLEKGFVLRTGSAFPMRDYFLQKQTETLDFVIKNRVNTIFMSADGAHKNLRAEIKKRGAKLRGPGHVWGNFIPDENLFAEHPEYFPMINGSRKPNRHTACFSHPDVLKIFTDKLRQYVRDNPYWDIFAFWAEDIDDPYYCGCETCAKKTVSDWYITLVNKAAKIIAEELPHATFEFIAYHGTRIPPQSVKTLYRNGEKMLFNFCGGYTRDLYHPFTQKRYGSKKVFELYRSWREYLNSAGYKGTILIMDYYNFCEWPNQGPRSRALLWPIEVIREDARFYLREGIAGVGDWVCFDYLCWPSPFVLWSWLQLWKNPEITVETLKQDFYPAYFGKTGTDVQAYIDKLETAMHDRNMPESLKQVKSLGAVLQSIIASAGETHRLKLLRIHHEYCVLLKEIWQDFSTNDMVRVKELETPFRDFFEKTYRNELSGEINIPPAWAYVWYDWFVKTHEAEKKSGEPIPLIVDEMLH